MKQAMMMIVAVVLMATLPVAAQDVARQKEKKTKLEKEIALLDRQIAEIKTKSSSATTRLSMLRKNIENRKSLIEESRALIKAYGDSLMVKDSEIGILESEVDTLLTNYEILVRTAYKYRNPNVWYLYVFASDNVGQAFRRIGYFRNISNKIREGAHVIRARKSDLELQKESLEALREEEQAVQASLEAELKNLRSDEKEADRLVQQLKNDRKKIESQIAAKKKEVQKLNKEIQRKIEEAQRAKGKSGSKKEDPGAAKLSGEFENNKGKLPWPVNGALVSSFGRQFHPVFKNLELPENEGIDIAADKGTSVTSVFNGQVLDVFVMPAYGQCVLIQHGKTYFTFYCKLTSLTVKTGDKVTTGQKIGVVDEIGGTSQIHFEIWKNKVPQNPANWLKKK